MWDTTDPRLLAVEVQRISEAPSSENDLHTKVHLREVMTLFATAEKGALLQDRFGLPDQASLFGLSVPSLFLTVAGNSRLGDAAMSARTMRDFVGMDRISDDTRKALLEFSFNLTMGNMDEAYRAVKLIKVPLPPLPPSLSFSPPPLSLSLSRPLSRSPSHRPYPL